MKSVCNFPAAHGESCHQCSLRLVWATRKALYTIRTSPFIIHHPFSVGRTQLVSCSLRAGTRSLSPVSVCVCSTLGNFTVPVNALVRSGPRSDFRHAGATGRPVVNSLRFFYFIFAATAGAALHPVKSLRRATLAPTQVLSATRLIRLRSLDCVGSLHILLDGRRPVSFPSFTSLRFFLANPLSWTSWLCRDALLSSGTMLVVSCLVKSLTQTSCLVAEAMHDEAAWSITPAQLLLGPGEVSEPGCFDPPEY